MQKINGRRSATAGLAVGLLGVMTCSAVSAARHYAHRVVHSVAHGRYEHALAGIPLGASVDVVLHRYGNPSEVQIERIMLVASTAGGGAGGGMGAMGGGPMGGGMMGGGAGTKTVPVKIFVGPSTQASGAGGMGAGGGMGAMGGGMMGAPGGGMGAGGGLGAMGGGMGGAPGSLGVGSLFQNYGGPPMMGGGPPGMGGPGGPMGGGFPGMGGPGGGTTGPAAGTLITPEHPETKFIYDEPLADSLEFVMSPTGHVEQIQATGYHGFVKTSRGVMLGEKYSQVLLIYGTPEKQQYSGPGGDILTVDYTNRDHCSFQFYNDMLVGITIAQVD